MRILQKFQSNANWFLFAAVLSMTLSIGCERSERSVVEESAGTAVAGTVQLEIDFQSDRPNIKVDVPCSADSTVLSILSRARNLGDVKFESRGEGETAFVTSIGGVENQLSAGDNWVYRVNDQLGDKSCGLFSVKPGDQVLWVFGKYP